MVHKNGRMIYGISFSDLFSRVRSRCNVTACVSDTFGLTRSVVLRASGPQYGAPLSVSDLSRETREEYVEWLQSLIVKGMGNIVL